MFKRRIYTISFISWMVLIALLSFLSFSGIEDQDIEIPHLDKVVHFILYFVAAILFCLFLREQFLGLIGIPKTVTYAVLSLIIYGIIIEVIQETYLIYRSGEIFDVLSNSAGACAGVLFIKSLFSGKRQLKWKN